MTVLSGPSSDSTPFSVGLLPGTVHEVSVRMAVDRRVDPVRDGTGGAECNDDFGDDVSFFFLHHSSCCS